MRAAFPLILVLCPVLHAVDPETSPRLIVQPDAFPTLVNPNCSHCRDEAKRRAGELRGDDRVLCWTRGYSDGGAIPYRFFLNTYPVISDSYGVFVHDHDAGFARGFAASYNFRFHGWRNGVMVMKHKDGTLYSCLSGVAFDGPKKGAKLAALPTLVSDWGFWLERYPHAVAYHMFDKYQARSLPALLSEEARKSRGPTDSRLPEESFVLGVSIGMESRAYPLAELETSGFLQDTLGGEALVVLWHGPTRTAAAYLPQAAPPRKFAGPRPDANGEATVPTDTDAPRRALHLRRDDRTAAAPFVDQETASRWDVSGRAVEGELKGWTLKWAEGTQVKWYAWAAEYPNTTINGK